MQSGTDRLSSLRGGSIFTTAYQQNQQGTLSAHTYDLRDELVPHISAFAPHCDEVISLHSSQLVVTQYHEPHE
jgi:hypothetical protein